MKTEHPIYKAYKDGKLIDKQSYAISISNLYSSQIDPNYCDDLRLFTGFVANGEPIYDGDTVYQMGKKGRVGQYESGEWYVRWGERNRSWEKQLKNCMYLTAPITLKQEQRVEERRHTHAYRYLPNHTVSEIKHHSGRRAWKDRRLNNEN